MTKPPLVPCTLCERHVRAGEANCPFCGEPGPSAAPPLRAPHGRLTSLMVMTFQAAAVSAAVTGCGGNVSEPDPSEATGGAAGQAGASGGGGSQGSGGSGDQGSGGRPSPGAGGRIDLGTGGDFSRGGAVPIYRATPRG